MRISLILSVFLALISIAFAQEETLTFTTYYPSPYGSYNEMRSRRLAVGQTYVNDPNVCWENCPAAATAIDTGTNLVVEGNVGIGTTFPASKLVIKGATADNSASALNVTNSNDASLFFIRNDGNAGIGTTNPQANLDVVGTVRIFGGWVKKATLTTDGSSFSETAASDGFVLVALATTSGSDSLQGRIRAKGSTGINCGSPLMEVGAVAQDFADERNPSAEIDNSTLFMPVKKNHCWKVLITSLTGSGLREAVVYWIPLGT